MPVNLQVVSRIRCLQTCVTTALPLQIMATTYWSTRIGGQFAFVEIITSMRRPKHFPRASLISLLVLVSAYFALGTVGYWSQVGPRDACLGCGIWAFLSCCRTLYDCGKVLALAHLLSTMLHCSHDMLLPLQGRDMTSDIIVWSLPQDLAARAAAAALLLQVGWRES